MRRSSIRALAEHLDVPLIVFKHAARCPNGGRITALNCTCATVVEEIPRDQIDAFLAEEQQLAHLARN